MKNSPASIKFKNTVNSTLRSNINVLVEIIVGQENKLMQLGVTNLIVDNSDFKPADSDRRFWSDLDFNNEIELTITI